MPTFIYTCKKNGQSYRYHTDTVLENVRDQYAWTKGVREYADNYHASLTTTGKAAFKGTETEFKTKVTELCDEALKRWNLGDLPGNRAEIDTDAASAAKYGMTVDQFKTLMAASKSAGESAVEATPKSKSKAA